MLLQLRQITSSGIEKVDIPDNISELNPEETYWLEIKTDDRPSLVEYLDSFNIDKKLLTYIGEPGSSSRIHVFAGVVLVDLPVSKTSEIHQTDYLTIFVKDNFLVTVIGAENTTLDAIEAEIRNNPFSFELTFYILMYYLASAVLQIDMNNASVLRNRASELTDKMEANPESVPLDDIMRCKKEVGLVANIVDDQYHMLSFTPKLDWTNAEQVEKIISEMKHLFQGFEYLKRNLERQEDKLVAIHSQYQLMLQEKGNKRLNILTIVQAIFVPLTLIAGIYGMNFVKMPELQWPFGYFLILGIMGFIILIELLWFKHKGWFN